MTARVIRKRNASRDAEFGHTKASTYALPRSRAPIRPAAARTAIPPVLLVELAFYYFDAGLSKLSASGLAWVDGATLQYSLPSLPLALEGSRYRERSYAATSLGLRLRLGEGPWFVRAGAVRDGSGTRPFAGLSYSAF